MWFRKYGWLRIKDMKIVSIRITIELLLPNKDLSNCHYDNADLTGIQAVPVSFHLYLYAIYSITLYL